MESLAKGSASAANNRDSVGQLKSEDNEKNTNRNDEAKKKKDKKPEMQRYQPPSTRVSARLERSLASAATSEPTDKKALKLNEKSGAVSNGSDMNENSNRKVIAKNIPDPRINAVKPTQNSEIKNRDDAKLNTAKETRSNNQIKEITDELNRQNIKSESSNRQNTICIGKNEVNVDSGNKIRSVNPTISNQNSHSGGLLKLKKNALDEILAKNNQPIDEISENSRHSQNKSFNKQHKNSNEIDPKEVALNPGKYKMLFDVNNPSKPIYVKDNNYNNNYQIYSSPQGVNSKSSYDLDHEARDGELVNPVIDNSEDKNRISSKRVLKVNALLEKFKSLDLKLKNLIDSYDINSSFSQFLNDVNLIRKQLEEICIETLTTHIETASNANVEVNQWRSGYHQIIEKLRKEYNNEKNNPNINSKLKESIRESLKGFIDEGFKFYTKLIETLEDKYLKFKAELLISQYNFNSVQNKKQLVDVDTSIKTKDMKFALMSINRSWISLGDLARYNEMLGFKNSSQANDLALSTVKDYSIARSYYLKAMAIAPKSSRAYHQLAIIAVYTKRRLDACYYYFRALEVSSPLTGVRQALISIFEEARLKSDHIIKTLNSYKEKQAKRNQLSDDKNKGKDKNRVEIWYKPQIQNNLKNATKNYFDYSDDDDDDDESDDNEEEEDDDDYEQNDSKNTDDLYGRTSKLPGLKEKKLSVVELNRSFMLNYLSAIGKLFTKVGMDTYQEVCSRMLHEFAELLVRKPCPLGKMRLIQIAVINISIIDLVYKSTNEQQRNPNNEYHRNQQLASCIQLGMDMFSLISKRFNNQLKNSPEFNSDKLDQEDIKHVFRADNLNWRHLLPSIKIFIDWMSCNIKIWHPLPDQLPPLLGPNPNRYQIIADLFNLVNKFYVKLNESLEDKETADLLKKLKLEEDLELAGFVPLLSLPREDYEYQNLNIFKDNEELISCLDDEILIEKVKDLKRMEKISVFAEYLCGLEDALMKYDVLNNCYIATFEDTLEINDKEKNGIENIDRRMSTDSNSSVRLNDIKDRFNDDLVDQHSTHDNVNINELKEKINMLKARKEEIEKKEKSAESVLKMNTERRLELEIRPKFIVPDTNCFIDHLHLIKKLLTSNYYILVIPLLVINELEKLTKSLANCNDDSIEHAEYVQKNAKKAIQFLNDKFENREKNIKALTSEGSVLDTIQFRSEEVKRKGTTDELILGCCLHYCRDNAREYMPNNKTDAIHLYRDVVLLTEDRHLRLKAHTRNVPVKNIKQFCKWSNIEISNRQTRNKK